MQLDSCTDINIPRNFICFYVLDDVKKADLALSMLKKDLIVLAQMSYVYALAFGVRKIYFTGSFINIRLVRQLLTMEIQGRSDIKPEVCM